MLDFTGKSKEIFQFMGVQGLPRATEDVLKFQLSQTKGEVPFQWKSVFDFNEVQIIQKPCEAAMKAWGYRQFSSEADFKRFKNPLFDYSF